MPNSIIISAISIILSTISIFDLVISIVVFRGGHGPLQIWIVPPPIGADLQ
jgi:hypothetical protein